VLVCLCIGQSGALIQRATAGVLGEVTVAATGAGGAELVEVANSFPAVWACAIWGTGVHGDRGDRRPQCRG
jgi:hypothetical protein